MLFKGIKKSVLSCLYFVIVLSVHAENNNLNQQLTDKKVNYSLLAKPQMCVVLDEGRECFAQITFTLSTIATGKVCLIQKSPYKVMYCVNEPNKKNNVYDFYYEFISDKTKTYQLVNQENQVLAETVIEVNWVYESSPLKRRWRAF